MNKQSENKSTPVKGDQNKAKITKDELKQQELDKVAGGARPIRDEKLSPTGK